MPFCTNCGTSVGLNASYCGHCGAAQPRTAGGPFGPPHGQFTEFLDGISERTASILCYIPVFGVIPAIVFLASQRFRTNMKVRFNGFQGLYLFVAWLIVSSAVPTLMMGWEGMGAEQSFVGALKAVLFICWIYLLVKAAQEQQVKLPLIGDLAARSTMEQL